MSLDADAVEADLAAYYDEEEGRGDRPVDPQRLAARDAFVASLAPSNRVLELGSGPGRDAAGFVGAGHRYVALDLSFGHCRRCRATGAPVVQASVRRLPVRDGSIDAVWTMSTLMHVPEAAIDGVLAEVRRVLVPGGRLAVGVWGGHDDESWDERPRVRRLFSRRSDDRWRAMLGLVGTIETYEGWSYDGAFDTYQWAVVRRSAT